MPVQEWWEGHQCDYFEGKYYSALNCVDMIADANSETNWELCRIACENEYRDDKHPKECMLELESESYDFYGPCKETWQATKLAPEFKGVQDVDIWSKQCDPEDEVFYGECPDDLMQRLP